MFYIKTQLTDEVAVTVEITEENVYTQCSGCGAEMPADLAELLSESGLYNTYTFCEKCMKQIKKQRSRCDDAPITLDGLVWLKNILIKSGYGEEIKELYDKYEIDELDGLTTKQYDGFGKALSDLATGK